MIERAIEIALQAPTGSNSQGTPIATPARSASTTRPGSQPAAPRAGRHVRRDDGERELHVAVVRRLILLIQKHAGTGEIYATPDCPEVYFLAGYKNPTRTPLDFFDDRDGRTERMVNMIDSRAIRVVVLDLHPSFSDVVADDLRSAVAQRFPERGVVGKFEVRWRS